MIKCWLFLVALLVAPFAARAQFFNPPMFMPEVAVAGYQGPGNVVSGALMWYGLRAYNTTYANATGKALNVVRASDSHTCDINVETAGDLGKTANCSTGGDNGQSASSFCNATTCTATTLYDQSGANSCNSNASACDLVQATAADQPTLTFSCVSTLPCLAFASSGTQFMQAAHTFTSNIAQQYTVTVEFDRTANPGAFQPLTVNDNSSSSMIALDGANNAILYAGSVSAAVTANDNAVHSAIGVFNSSSSILVIDGAATTGLNPGTDGLFNANTPTVGKDPFSQVFTGDFFEDGAWASGFSSGQYTSMAGNMDSYY